MNYQSQDEIISWLKEKNNVQSLLPQDILLVDKLAVGGQGVIFKGQISRTDAAIKVYFPGQLQQRIDREVAALKMINCHSLVRLLWNGNIQVSQYTLPVVATEFIDGQNLHDLLIQSALTFDDLGRLVFDISTAINALWSRRIVHRDIKPSNILIRENKRACVIDLGVARHLDETTLTAWGETWGTLGYLSPEQAHSVQQLTCKSDIYALGIVIIESCLRAHPSNGDQLRLFSMNLNKKLPEPLNSWEYSELVKTMLDPEPIRRPKPQELLQAFKTFTNEVD